MIKIRKILPAVAGGLLVLGIAASQIPLQKENVIKTRYSNAALQSAMLSVRTDIYEKDDRYSSRINALLEKLGPGKTLENLVTVVPREFVPNPFAPTLVVNSIEDKAYIVKPGEKELFESLANQSYDPVGTNIERGLVQMLSDHHSAADEFDDWIAQKGLYYSFRVANGKTEIVLISNNGPGTGEFRRISEEALAYSHEITDEFIAGFLTEYKQRFAPGIDAGHTQSHLYGKLVTQISFHSALDPWKTAQGYIAGSNFANNADRDNYLTYLETSVKAVWLQAVAIGLSYGMTVGAETSAWSSSDIEMMVQELIGAYSILSQKNVTGAEADVQVAKLIAESVSMSNSPMRKVEDNIHKSIETFRSYKARRLAGGEATPIDISGAVDRMMAEINASREVISNAMRPLYLRVVRENLRVDPANLRFSAVKIEPQEKGTWLISFRYNPN